MARVVGGAAPFDPALDLADAEADPADGACYVGALHPITPAGSGGAHGASCVSLALDVSAVDDASAARPSGGAAPVATIQAALRYTAASGEARLRTITCSARLTATRDEWLASVDVGAASLLMARLAALRAGATERDTRDPAALSRTAAQLAAELARARTARRLLRRGRARDGDGGGGATPPPPRGWLSGLVATAAAAVWNRAAGGGTTAVDVRRTPCLAALLRRLHGLCASASSLAVAGDADAAHAARLLLLSAAPPLAARMAGSRCDGDGGDDEDDALSLPALTAAAERLAVLSVGAPAAATATTTAAALEAAGPPRRHEGREAPGHEPSAQTCPHLRGGARAASWAACKFTPSDVARHVPPSPAPVAGDYLASFPLQC